MKIRVQILRNIERPQMGTFYARSAHIEYDAKAPTAKKSHGIIFQQGDHYGSVGDKADYMSHAELLKLEEEGFVRIIRTR